MVKIGFLCQFIPNRRVVSLIAQNIETVEEICKRACIKARNDHSSLTLCNDKKKLDQNKLIDKFSKDDLCYLTVENEDSFESMKKLQFILDKDRSSDRKSPIIAEIQLVLHIRGAGNVPMKFANFEHIDTIKDLKFQETRKIYRIVDQGLSIKGKCENQRYEAFKEMVIFNGGLGYFSPWKKEATCPHHDEDVGQSRIV